MAAVDTLIQVIGRKVNPISRLNVPLRVPPVPQNDHPHGDTSLIIQPSTRSEQASAACSPPKHVRLPPPAVSRSIPLHSSSSSAQRCVSSQPRLCDDALKRRMPTERHHSLARFPHRCRLRHAACAGRIDRGMSTSPNGRGQRLPRSRLALLPTQPPPHCHARDREPSHP